MPKIFYTERDIDDLHSRAITSIDINTDVVLTDLARERMLKYGMTQNRIVAVKLDEVHSNEFHSQEELIARIKSSVLARLDKNVDPDFLDRIIRRILDNME